MKKFIRQEKGGVSLIFVLLGFLLIFVIGGGRNIMMKKLSIAEVTDTMDIAGVSALRTSINNDAHRIETSNVDELFDKQKARTVYLSLLKNSLEKQKFIVSYDIVKIDVDTDQSSNWRFDDNKQRMEAYITSTLAVKYNAGFFDNFDFASKTFYNSKKNDVFSVEFTGITNDGFAELLIHSTSRIVLK